jgi:hypothetical protein
MAPLICAKAYKEIFYKNYNNITIPSAVNVVFCYYSVGK